MDLKRKETGVLTCQLLVGLQSCQVCECMLLYEMHAETVICDCDTSASGQLKTSMYSITHDPFWNSLCILEAHTCLCFPLTFEIQYFKQSLLKRGSLWNLYLAHIHFM